METFSLVKRSDASLKKIECTMRILVVIGGSSFTSEASNGFPAK